MYICVLISGTVQNLGYNSESMLERVIYLSPSSSLPAYVVQIPFPLPDVSRSWLAD